LIPIVALVDRIRWDRDYGDAEFQLGYWDRVMRRIVRVPMRRVHVEPGERFSFEAVEDDGSVHNVPFHRAREVWRNGVLVWRRHGPEEAMTRSPDRLQAERESSIRLRPKHPRDSR